jgi:hypothetical protein
VEVAAVGATVILVYLLRGFSAIFFLKKNIWFASRSRAGLLANLVFEDEDKGGDYQMVTGRRRRGSLRWGFVVFGGILSAYKMNEHVRHTISVSSSLDGPPTSNLGTQKPRAHMLPNGCDGARPMLWRQREWLAALDLVVFQW